MNLVRTALAAALAFAALPASAQQQTYSQTVFFGDSLTDSGTFRPAIMQAFGPQASILGRFTTNPGLVWAEHVADFYGTSATPSNQGGTNYAAGGARVATPVVTGFGPAPSLQSQVTTYLGANAGRADPNALFTVWGGANDLFAIAAGAPAQPTLTAAVGTQIGLVQTLTSAGARYILVPTLPDMGTTPSARAAGAAAQAQFTSLSSTYNASLFNGLAGANLRVIPLNTFALLREVVANPAQFGFTNVTGTACVGVPSSVVCSPANLVSPDAPNTYLFADGVHPTTGAHRIVGDYAISILEAPRQIAVFTHSAGTVGRSRAERVFAQAEAGAQGDATGSRWWADVRGDFQRYEHGDLYDGAGPALTVGADWRSGGLVFGGFGGFGRSMLDWGNRRGEFDQSEATLGGYLGFRAGGAWVSGLVSYTGLDFDSERRVALRNAVRIHKGSVDGSNLTAGVEGGWEFGAGTFKHGPVVGLLSQRIEIDGFAEDQPELSTSLAYPEQEFDSLIGKLGWQARLDTGAWKPYARLTVDRQFEDQGDDAFARSQTLAATGNYAVPGVQFDDSYATVKFGVRGELFGMHTDVGASATAGQDVGNDASVFLTVGGGF